MFKYAITILLSEALNKKYNDYAKTLLVHFVINSEKLYGQEFCIYNTHCLIHLPQDARDFGSLNTVNCFPFENYLQKFKRLLRKSNAPLQQVVKRLFEMETQSEQAVKETIFWLEGIGPELYQLVYSALLPSAQRCTDIVYFGIQASVLPSAIVSY